MLHHVLNPFCLTSIIRQRYSWARLAVTFDVFNVILKKHRIFLPYLQYLQAATESTMRSEVVARIDGRLPRLLSSMVCQLAHNETLHCTKS